MRSVLEAYGIERLPPALQEIIRLRVNYPDATLKELGKLNTKVGTSIVAAAVIDDIIEGILLVLIEKKLADEIGYKA